MNKFWSNHLSDLLPYTAGEQPNYANIIKLNTNENAFGPSPKVFEGLQNFFGDSLRLYPDPDSKKLVTAIANNFSLSTDQVFVGNGSDEVLAHIFYGLLKHDYPIIFPDITYSFYKTYARLYNISYELIPLSDNFTIIYTDFLRNNGGIIIANPNAPTGIELGQDAIINILEFNQDSVVVIDEAYVDFGSKSCVSLINRFPNLLVVQTFSKSRSLAGMRVGFAMGQSHLIEALVRIKNSFNSYPLDCLAQLAAQYSMEDTDWFNYSCNKIITERQWLADSLIKLGFRVLPSAANFIFIEHYLISADIIVAQLRSEHIYVRHFPDQRIKNWLRVTVGNNEQHHRLLSVLSTFLCKLSAPS